jgi:hypothetical protein
MTDDHLMERLQKQILKKLKYNLATSLDLVPISDSGFLEYKKQLKITQRQGKSKPKSRGDDFLSIRNPYFFCSLLVAERSDPRVHL